MFSCRLMSHNIQLAPHPRSCSRALERAQLVARDARDRLKAQGKAYGVPKVVHDAFAKTRDARDDALVGLDAEETRARAKDISSEEAELVALDEGVGAADRDVERCAMDFRDATERARRGGKADELRLPRLRAAISESEVARREALTMLNLAKSRRDRNERKRRERIEFSHEVRFRAAQLGEADALAALAREESEQFIKGIGGPTYISGLKGKRLGEYRATAAKLEREDLRARTAKDELKRALDAFEAELEVRGTSIVVESQQMLTRTETRTLLAHDATRVATRRDATTVDATRTERTLLTRDNS